MEERNLRKVMIGTVTSDKMDKTVVVAVETNVRHKVYGKIVKEAIEKGTDCKFSVWDRADGEFTTEPVKTQYGYHVILKVSSSAKKKYKDAKKEIVKTLAEQK